MKTKQSNINKEAHIKYIIEAVANGWSLKSNGFIYKVKRGFFGEKEKGFYIKEDKVLHSNLSSADTLTHESIYLKEGDFIEFRYEYDAFCRTKNGVFFKIDPSILALKCEPFAKIYEKTRFENKLSLQEILQKKLYDKVL